MSNFYRERILERLQYWEGQRLLSSDFRAQERTANEYRWWHNRSLHNAYGISMGLSATADASGLSLSCGLAYDCYGRELLLPASASIPFPKSLAADRPYLLIATYESDESARTANLAWMLESRFTPQAGVPIAAVLIDAAGKPALDTTFEPPQSRPLSRPHIASGVTPPGGTAWETWSESNPNIAAPSEVAGLQIRIDTSAAGFTDTPVYIAQLQSAIQPVLHILPPAFCHVEQAQPSEFLFRIWLPRLFLTKVAWTVPEAKISDIGEDNKVILKTPSDFLQDDVIKRKGEAKTATIQHISDDQLTLTLSDDLGFKPKSTMRLAEIPNSERLATLLGDLQSYPGVQLLIAGTGLDNKPAFSRVSVKLSSTGAVITPEITPFKIGDTAATTPEIISLSTLTLDLPLIVQNLGWYVTWIGVAATSRISLSCDTGSIRFPAKEIC
ncbi:MAG TPA: hypothetical protein VHE81_07800 [Lacipirellulaceae bacterium]|jgi:hypothetical protein|nr:hypothetical protein [Lacipirellulaceae bacterium]